MVYNERMLEENSTYAIKRIDFKSAKSVFPGDHDIVIHYYDIHGDDKRPVIMVLPILGGSYKITRNFAAYFSEHGYASVLVLRQKEHKRLRHIDTIDTTLKQIVFDLMQVIDWIETQEDLDKSKIGVFGVSMGGIKSSLISALDDRIDASVIALAAGDIPYLLTYSKEEGIVKEKNRFLKERDLTPDTLYGRLRETITCDPMNYAEYIDAKDVLMILALFDKIVPYAKGKELRERIGRPETIVLFSGHYTAYPYIFYIKSESLKFFKKRFEGG
ncbi:MAG: alpha/beta hydrolase family protein [bacterium]